MEVQDYFYKTLLLFARVIPFSRVRRKARSYVKSLYAINVLSKREIALQLKIRDYLKTNYVDPYLSSNKDYSHLFKAKKQIKANSVIWQYWAQGINDKTPLVVKACIKSVDKYKGVYKHIILTDDTIFDYLEIPQDIIEKYKHKIISPTFFSDFLRVSLLSLYGGVWVDATALLTKEIPNNVLNSDFFMFERNSNIDEVSKRYWVGYDYSYFGFSKDFQVICLTSFMVAKKDNICAIALRDLWYLYWQKESRVIHYYFFQILYKLIYDYDDKKYSSSIFLDDIKPHEIRCFYNKKFTDMLWNSLKTQSFVYKLSYEKHISKRSMLWYILEKL